MKIAVIGATGFVGTQIVNELLHRKHTIKAFARNIDKIAKRDGLEVIALDVNHTAALVDHFKNVDIVVSAYSAGWTNPSYRADFLKGSQAIQEAAKEANVNRLIVIGGAGSLQATADVQLVDTPEFPAEIKSAALAVRDYLTILRDEKELDWTFFSPAIEMHAGTSGVRKGTYRLGTDYPVVDEQGRSVLSVEDVAVVIADEIEQPKHSKTRFTAAY